MRSNRLRLAVLLGWLCAVSVLPECNSEPVYLEVREGLPIGTSVGFIRVQSGFTYRFNDQPKEFELNATSGEIRTAAVLDRESLQNDRIDLVVLSSQPTYPVEVRIVVVDVNDNSPQFPEPSLAVQLSESSAINKKIFLTTATDRDIGNNGITSKYRIVRGNDDGKFDLRTSNDPNTDSVLFLYLETVATLDREQKELYTLNISAEDGGSPPLHGYLIVNITVLDTNDNPPIFDHSAYSVSINESVPAGHRVLQVHASDADAGDNARISYSLAESNAKQPNQFSIDQYTGVISTNFDNIVCSSTRVSGTGANKSCVLTVYARDNGSPRQDGRTYVTVNLVDTNDHDPQITFRVFGEASATDATVDENAERNQVVAAISVLDGDDGLNGETDLVLSAGNDMKHFRLDNEQTFYSVRVDGVLDREKVPWYNLTFVATDKGAPSRSSTKFLIIQVNDVNDHEPQFEKSEYSVALSETVNVGSYVVAVSATDEDTGVNALVFYGIESGNDRHWFAIDKKTGLVTTVDYLNREEQDLVELKIYAHDGGPNRKFAYTTLKIHIQDENDEPPSFAVNDLNVTLSENSPPHTLVAIVTATDNDLGPNGTVSYALQASVKLLYGDTFEIDPIYGRITTAAALDREKCAFYQLTVIAKDNGQPSLSSSLKISVRVADVNDNKPILYPSLYFHQVRSGIKPGAFSTRVLASDADEGVNARIVFSIVNGAEDRFKINDATGQIHNSKVLDARHQARYEITVSAINSEPLETVPGGPVVSNAASTAMVVVFVRDGSFRETRAEGNYTFSVPESSDGRRRELGALKKLDGAKYSIVNGDPFSYFSIDPLLAVVYTTGVPIDRERMPSTELTVVANTLYNFTTYTVAVQITDVNDNAPTFDRPYVTIRIPESFAIGLDVFVSQANDVDEGPGARILYSLDDPEDLFSIDERSGVVRLKRSLRGQQAGRTLPVKVTARNEPNDDLSSSQLLLIEIEDVNDHTPFFDHASYEISLAELTPVNERFFSLYAADDDVGENGRVSYAITEGNREQKFGIFPDGQLYVKEALDHEHHDFYVLVITARDNGARPRSSSVPLTIHIIDDNDNAPRFASSGTELTFSITENQEPDSFVGILLAEDADSGRNAELSYSLSSDQTDFAVDPKSGVVRTLKSFDRERLVETTGHDYITVETSVSDNGNPRLRCESRMVVRVLDENDNAPVFSRKVYRSSVSESTPANTQVARVSASDPDDGANGMIVYTVPDTDVVSIDSVTGQITLTKPLDRENVTEYSLTVIASDAAPMPSRRSAVATLNLIVLDENDNRPLFDASTQESREIAEDTEIGAEIYRFSARDVDLGLNGEVSYSISAGNAKDAFKIDAITGVLRVNKALDFELKSSYALNITAADGGSPSLSTTIAFNVKLTDVNDNAPVFPNGAIVRTIREGVTPDTVVASVVATDRDLKQNSKISYSLTGQAPHTEPFHFRIKHDTGQIYTAREIDREFTDTYKLTITATDHGEPPLTSEKALTLVIEDVNDNAPSFISVSTAVLPVPANRSHSIMAVTATDPDAGTNGQVSYELVGGNHQLFDLDRTTGEILLKQDTLPTTQLDVSYQLKIRAFDEAPISQRRSSETKIVIITSAGESSDIRFEKTQYSGSIGENEPAGTSVLSVRAVGRADSELEYYVTAVSAGSSPQGRKFVVDIKTGVIETATPLDREQQPEPYEVVIYATDRNAKTPMTARTRAIIRVLDRNDTPPKFTAVPYAIRISEDAPTSSTVLTVHAEDPDLQGSVKYELVPPNNRSAFQGFQIDLMRGHIVLVEQLDREIAAHHELVVRVSDGVQSCETNVDVTVLDTNDNSPVFSQNMFSFDIPEDTPRGHRIGTVRATDADIGQNSQVSYSVLSDWGNDLFSLNPQTGVFTLTSSLDYEQYQHYIFAVSAQDAGVPSLSSTVTVYMNVVDLNDNSPVFDPLSYSADVSEDAALNSSVLTVHASDLDSGPNGEISYTILEGDDDHHFEISRTGKITTAKPLDRETRAQYNLIVCAEDRAANPRQRLSSTAQVTIVVRDVNDITPHFVSPNSSSIVENAPLNTIVMAVKAVDGDEGRNSHIEYAFASRSESHFSIGPVDGLLRVNSELDRELKSEYQVVVVARDRGKPSLSATTTIAVHVLDENDNNPVFEQRQYDATISENSPVEMSVIRVSATDLDVGPSGLLRYSIVAGDPNHDFSIDEETGTIRVHKQVDYERKNRYVITVQAEDSSADARYDTAMISITLKDVNDNPPTFLDNPYEASVVENAFIPAGGALLVTQMQALDVDADSNRNIYYRLLDGDKTLFRVNSSNGNIYALRSLDREQQSEYTATILAIDSGTPRLTGTGTLVLTVSDVNDNAPVFEKPSFEIHVAENLPAGTSVAKITATDSDQGLNAVLRYALDEPSDWFQLDPETGVLTARQSLDREKHASYDLKVNCSDSGLATKKWTVAGVRVLVDDVNDNAPEFPRSIYSVKVDDAGAEGSFVFGEQAHDADVGINSQVEYSLSGPDVEFFDIESATGVVKQRKPTMTNRQTPYELRLIATDKGQPPMSSNVTLRVRVERHLDFPEIREMKKLFVLPEDTAVGFSLTSVRAKSSLYSTFNYRIAGGNLGQAFGVNSSTGAVFVANELDYETVKEYRLWIQAENTSSKLSAAAELLIRIQDVNDNSPLCSQRVFNVTVMEEQAPPEFVAQVSASDADEGTNGEVFYQFESVAETSLFSIESDSGRVHTRSKLDRETMSRYRLKVQAVDRGFPARTGTCTVLVDVADKNDNSPRFTRLFSANVSEDAALGTFVIQMTSIDSDIGPNAIATYSLNDNPGGKFVIDSTSGNVTVAGALDRELKDEYNLKVTVFDGAWKKDTPLTITVTDVNDNSPAFGEPEYAFYFTEQQPVQSFVGRVQANDRDKEGRNSRITYFLKRPSELFHVDSITGNITTKRSFIYRKSRRGISPENKHVLRIVATDYGKPALTGETTVTIHVMDKSSSAPVFGERSYFVPVPEETATGTSLVQMAASSEDGRLDSEVLFHVVGGNGTDLIELDANSGWIALAKSVRERVGELFEVEVSACESRAPLKKSFATVSLKISYENKHAPTFSSASYQISVAENEPVGNELLTIQASDADEGINGQVTFSLEPNENFAIDKHSGVVKLNRSLDFETAQGYSLRVTARDLAFNSFTAVVTLTVVVTDVNDCAPRFSDKEFHVYIHENEPIDTEITRLEATDDDSPRNRIIRYSLLGPQVRLFAIDDVSGVLVSKAVFDFEEQGTFELEVVASNPGTVQFTSAKVTVHVLGKNEFYPKFTQRIFEFQASESDPVGKFVGNITAVDQDAGEDGVVLYFLVGANNERGFKVDARTGTISVARKPDRENEARVVLTAIAKNGGSIRGNDTDEAQVVILIQDGNDPPVFTKPLYEVKVSEDVEPDHYVVTVSATDRDVRPSNNQFVYAILDGNTNRAFTVDPNTGDLHTALVLDRERVPQYNLTVAAIDNGIPSQTGQTTVLVTVADVNDNAPYFEDAELVGHVAENEPPYTSVMALSAKDKDAPPNSGPFAYFLVGGAHKNKFELDRHSGVLRTVESLDREATPQLSLLVEVRDNGTPMHKSRTAITVKVADKNDNPSSARNVTVIVWTLNGVFPGGKIADVQPLDVDTVGDFSCRIQSGDTSFFSLARHCALQSRRSEHPENYVLSIRGNDGRHQEVQCAVTVQFRSFDNSTLKQSITVMWPNSTADEFLSQRYENFMQGVSQATSHIGAPVAFSISESQNSVQISVAVQKRPGVYASPAEVRAALQKTFVNSNFVVGYDPCDGRPCLNGAHCQPELEQSGQFRFSSSDSLIITSPSVVRVAKCTCPLGYFGPRCESQRNPCSPNPCSPEATCHPDQRNSFYCACPPHLLGKLCELQNTDSCTAAPCRNGGSCENSPSGGFFCLCKPGFKGTFCEHRSDSCRPNRCLNGGVCFADKAAYHCECKANYYGKHCEKTTYGFHPYSFMEFPTLRSSTNDISIVFATSKRNALLAYNYGSQSGGRSDFISLELVEGKPKFSFGGSRTAISSVSLNSVVADGQWHKVTVFRNGKTASLSVVDCVRYGELCEECSHSNATCSASVLGHSGTLGFNNNPLYIGGVPYVEAILERPSQLSSDDFVGCVHSVSINGKSLDLESPLRSQFISDVCPRESEVCASKCGGNECIDEWFSSSCVCPNGMIAPDCQLESSSVFAIGGGAFLDLVPREKQRRTILQHQMSRTLSHADLRTSVEPEPVKSMTFSFRTKSANGLLMLSTTESDFTKLELSNGRLTYHSQFKGDRMISVDLETPCADGQWHTVTLIRYHEPKPWISMSLNERTVDIRLAPEAHGVHDFIDPFLTNMWLGGYAPGLHSAVVGTTPTFVGCIQGISVNREVQSMNSTRPTYFEVTARGEILNGCSENAMGAAFGARYPLNIGIVVVIVFFATLICGLFASYTFFKQCKSEDGSQKSEHKISNTYVSPSPARDSQDVGAQDLVTSTPSRPEAAGLQPKKQRSLWPPTEAGLNSFQDVEARDNSEHERRDIYQSRLPAYNIQAGSEAPECYDFENASSIAPSDIDIVYHYKAYRDAAGAVRDRKNKPPVPYQNRLSPANANMSNLQSRQLPHSVLAQRLSPLGNIRKSPSHVLQNTPLARLSPSSEVSQPLPRILTLQDISGKPIQNALLASKNLDPMAISDRSLGSPVSSSHLASSKDMDSTALQNSSLAAAVASAQLSKLKGTPTAEIDLGLTQDEIERLDFRRNSSMMRALDAVTSETDDDINDGNDDDDDDRKGAEPGAETNTDCRDDDSSADESENESFTCSEFEFGHNYEKIKSPAKARKQPAPDQPPQNEYALQHIGEERYNAYEVPPPGPPGASMNWNLMNSWAHQRPTVVKAAPRAIHSRQNSRDSNLSLHSAASRSIHSRQNSRDSSARTSLHGSVHNIVSHSRQHSRDSAHSMHGNHQSSASNNTNEEYV